MAGDHPRRGFSGAACVRGCAELGWIQCGPRRRSGAGRTGRGGGRIRIVVPAERCVVLRRHHFSAQMAARRPMNHFPGRACGTSIAEGFRYVRGAPEVRSVLIRTGAFSLGATSLLALLPVICQPHGAQGYGFLLTCFGLGALAGAAAAAAVTAALLRRRTGRRSDRDFRRHDIPGRTSSYF